MSHVTFMSHVDTLVIGPNYGGGGLYGFHSVRYVRENARGDSAVGSSFSIMTRYQDQPEILWKPPNNGRLTRVESFRRFINRKHGLSLNDYHDLHKYSTEDWEFWRDLWEFIGIASVAPPRKVVREKDDGSMEFFPDVKLNYAENLLRRNDEAIAVTAIRETGSVSHYTRRQLKSMVRIMSNSLRYYGIKPFDRVAAITTNSINAVVLALACATVGALYSTTAPDMGVPGILDRYRQITPKLLFTDTEVLYAGTHVDLLQKIEDVSRDLTSKYGLTKVILFPSSVTNTYPNCSISASVTLDEFLAKGAGELVFEQLPFNHPLWILFSSGTTGPPKCIVHSAGGTLIQKIKEWTFAFDAREDDCIQRWMMFASQIGALHTCRILLYDGSPFHPSLPAFLKMISDQGVTVLGIGPRFLGELQGSGIKPWDIAPFPSFRVLFSTGAVLTPPMFRWVYEVFPKHVFLAVTSGGTDVCAAFITAVPSLPIYAGEMQGKSLGMRVEVFDSDGKNIEDTFTPGELVCTRAHPSLPLYFWGDKDGKKYKSAYFEKYPGVWTQGDFIIINPVTKGIRILGRSDGVLNPSGVRFGSGEVYSALERFADRIDDTLCIGQRRARDTDEQVLLFVKLRPGYKLTQEFEEEIHHAIRTSLSKRHEPKYIFEVSEIPYTINNKKIETAVKQIVSGHILKPSGTIANPNSLEQYKKYFELEKLVNVTSKSQAKL